MLTEEHRSPDGILTLVVEEVSPGDLAIGFAESQWHIHDGMLIPEWGVTREGAVSAYVNSVLRNEAIIGVRRRNGTIVEVWITYDPSSEVDRALPDETLELRYWSGKAWAGSPRKL